MSKRRLTASKLDLAIHCLYWATLDIEDKANAAGEFGTRFHILAAAYVLGNPLPFEPEPELKTMFEAWARNEKKRRPKAPVAVERAYALTLDGERLLLGTMLERDYSSAPDWAICGTLDLEGFDTIVDYKTGKERFAPHDAWQLRFAAAVTDLPFGEFHYVGRSGRTTVKSTEFTAEERSEYRAQLIQLGRRLRDGDTAPVPGNHCDAMYCPARSVCPAYREAHGLSIPKKQEKHMSRMRLDKVTKGRIAEPFRVLLYGPEGIGKSTFGADSPSPIFISSERGTAELDITRFPEPECWQDVFDAVTTLAEEGHEHRTLVIDTVDWLEPLCHAHVCAVKSWANIDDPAWGAGYNAALEEWRKLLAAFDHLQDVKQMHIILLGHSHTRGHRHPELDDFDRFELAINKKAAGLIKQWCRTVLFADYETETFEQGKRTRAIDSGNRYIHTSWRAAFDAKNRCGLPPKIPLGWAEFEAACNFGAPATVDDLKTQLVELLSACSDPVYRGKATEHITRAGNDAKKLSEILDRVKARITNQQEVAA